MISEEDKDVFYWCKEGNLEKFLFFVKSVDINGKDDEVISRFLSFFNSSH